MLRLLHISDTHSSFPPLQGKFDAVIHTGDFFPNSRHIFNKDIKGEKAFQLEWLRSKLIDIASWLGNKPFLYVPGNHDFLDHFELEAILNKIGVKVFDLTNKVVSFEGINFYGFPYVPPIYGMWNYEKENLQMKKEVRRMIDIINGASYINILACHSPLYQCLDYSNNLQFIGSSIIADALNYEVEENKLPGYYLHGHCHESHGMAMRNGMLVSNAATTQRIIEI